MVTVPSATMQSDKWRFEEPTPPWRPTGDPVADTQQQQAALAATRSFHPLRQLYRDCLTNTFSVQSLVLALAILVAMYWATRLFLRLFFWLSDRYDAWRHGNAVVLAPFESEVSVCFAGCTTPPPPYPLLHAGILGARVCAVRRSWGRGALRAAGSSP